MADEFVMPKLGLTMEAGTIVSWLVEDGAEVQLGQAVLTIETDKVESEVEATGAGLFHHLGEIGQEYPCGAPIGWLLSPGEDVPTPPVAATAHSAAPANPGNPTPAAVGSVGARPVAATAETGSTATGTTAGGVAVAATGEHGRLLASPNARRLAAARGIDLWTLAGSGPGGRITSEDVPEQPVKAAAPLALPAAGAGGGVALATAAARQLAELLGIDVRTVASAGPDPRISREDVAAHVRALLAAQTAVPAPPPPAPGPVAAVSSAVAPLALVPATQTPSSTIPMRGMRGTIADRMSKSLHSMAQLTLTMDVDMDRIVADRASRKAATSSEEQAVPGYTDYVIAAVAAALVDHPAVNSQITDEGVALLPQVNVGLAVALDDGLIVPVIHDTPSLMLDELAAETTRLAGAARDGKLQLPELEGGTFSVTALGMFDVDAFTPIINAPNTAILGVGRLRDDVAWSADGSPVRASRLTLSLTWDHRAFDGAPAAEFTRSIKAWLEAYGG